MKKDQLTAQDELFLTRIVNSSDSTTQLNYKWALDKLVTHNLGLVHKVVHRFPLKNASVTYDDLFQEGVAGLIHGIKKFDNTRGYRLSTYVYRWISAYVTRYWQNQSRVVRIPVHVSESQQSLRKKVEAMTLELERQPTTAEIEARFPEYETVQAATRDTFSLNQLVGEDGELQDLAGEDHTDVTDTKLEVELLLDELRRRVSRRDYDVLVMRYGLEGFPEHTLSEVSEITGVTRARCHQIQQSMLKELRSISRR